MRQLVLSGFLVTALLAPAALTDHVAARDWVPFAKLPNAGKVRAAQQNLGAGPRGGRARDVRFDVDAQKLAFRRGDKWFVIPYAGGEPTQIEEPEASFVAVREEDRGRRGGAARGRQVEKETAPDGSRIAIHREGNVWIAERGGQESALTTDGTAKIKYGTASWVYGEELDQTTAMWWSPDSKKLAFYRFDETDVIEFQLPVGWTKLRPGFVTEAYPKPGEPNPIATLMIFDFDRKVMTTVDVGPDREQYIYGIEWLPDSSGILFRRTNRRQDVLDLVVAAADTGASRVVLTEKQATWQENSPQFRWLSDGKRFLWESEASGFSQYQLWSIDGSKLAQVTTGDYPIESIVRVDENAGELWYTARSSETKINSQLHRAKLDGSGSVRLTREDLDWSGFAIAPDGSRFIATSEFVDVLPSSHLFDREGNRLATLAQAEGDPWAEAGVGRPEFVRLVAADGETPIYGILSKPSNFDPTKQYPLVVSAYGGPFFAQVSPRFSMGRPECEFGVLMLTIDNRGTPGRGKAFEGATYLSLGEEDCDDQAAAAKQIAERPYVAKDKIAITGHSYGGYMTLIAMLRYPDLFKVGVAAAPPTDWRHYDTIYTERYMRTPAENPEGYDNFSCVKLADKLRGKLLVMQGMVDDNVHPTNSWQFIDALQQKERPFEMMFFPRADHGIFSPSAEAVKWSFLLEHLGLR